MEKGQGFFGDSVNVIRYAIPGFISIVEFIAATYIQKYELDAFRAILGDDLPKVIGVVIIASVVSGYLLASIYFCLVWSVRFLVARNHSGVLDKLVDVCGYKIYGFGHQRKLSRREKWDRIGQAWVIFNQFWFYLIDQQSGLAETNKYITKLAHLLHSLGTTILGSIISLAIWYLSPSNLFLGQGDNKPTIACVWLAVIGVLIVDYWHQKKTIESIASNALINTISNLEAKKWPNRRIHLL